MTTAGARLRAYMEARYLELGLGKRHGFVMDMERRSGVKRATLNGWFQRSSLPRLDALGDVANVLQVTRSELVAAFDGREVIELDRARAMLREELERFVAAQPGSEGQEALTQAMLPVMAEFGRERLENTPSRQPESSPRSGEG